MSATIENGVQGIPIQSVSSSVPTPPKVPYRSTGLVYLIVVAIGSFVLGYAVSGNGKRSGLQEQNASIVALQNDVQNINRALQNSYAAFTGMNSRVSMLDMSVANVLGQMSVALERHEKTLVDISAQIKEKPVVENQPKRIDSATRGLKKEEPK
jgi:hypothetical protein